MKKLLKKSCLKNIIVLPLYSKTLVTNLQKDRGVFIPGCPIVVDVEVGPSWGELSKYELPK